MIRICHRVYLASMILSGDLLFESKVFAPISVRDKGFKCKKFIFCVDTKTFIQLSYLDIINLLQFYSIEFLLSEQFFRSNFDHIMDSNYHRSQQFDTHDDHMYKFIFQQEMLARFYIPSEAYQISMRWLIHYPLQHVMFWLIPFDN